MAAEHQAGNTLAERRKHPRHLLQLTVHYQVSGQPNGRSFATRITTHDLGIGGMAIRVWEKIEVGQILLVQVGLPNPGEAAGANREDILPIQKLVTLTARAVWRWPNSGSQYLVGIQFLDLEQQDAQALKAFLQEYSLQDSNVETSKRAALLSKYQQQE